MRTDSRIATAVLVSICWTGGAAAQSATSLPTIVIETRKSTATTSKSPRRVPAKRSPSQSTQPATGGDAAVSSAASWPPSADALRGEIPLVGIATTASSGIIGQDRLEARSPFRPAEILEAVPGLIVTQHSGEGKANQYYLRGFNLDHGTDLAIFFDGMPINMPSHGHGQGYADMNFMIPELARGLAFHKGPYFADEGNFASAGAIHIDYVDSLAKNIGQIEVGSFGYRRALGAMSASQGSGNVLAAAALQTYDGPWSRPDDLRKATGVLRYSTGTRDNGFAVTGMGYAADWYSTDQIPQRAVDRGLIGRYGNLDDTDGGNTGRYSLSARWAQRGGGQATRISAYAVRSNLNLFSNFTYFLDDDVNGDQFHQMDRRTIIGGRAAHVFYGTLMQGVKTETEIGLQVRHDDIHNGLFKTRARERLSTVREDRISETTAGIYSQNTTHWTPWFRTIAGLRGDWHRGNVDSNLAANSGTASDVIASPKLGVVFGPWARTELYLSSGFGHHSNDLRGATSVVDPADGVSPVSRSPLLVRSKGAEMGIRSEMLPGLQFTASTFVLDYESEIVFIGDAGSTEASRPSRRIGWEITLLWRILPWMMLDAEYASTHARFKTDDPGAPGRYIPGAVDGVAKIGLKFDNVPGLRGWFASVNWRYFGPRPLIEDNSVRSKSTAPLSAQIGYKFSDTFIARLDGFNLLNQKASQIDYYSASRLQSEVGAVSGVDDI
ncbi:MAG: TonB-dependent receptor, partial [Hyphomicrobiaceae bacterium]